MTLLKLLAAAALSALVGAGLLMAACGGDDDDVTATPSPEPDAPADPSENEGEALKIGFLVDYSGALAEYGVFTQTGVELAIKHINEAGGVNGQDVTFVTGDTRVDAIQAVEEARRLVDVEGVHAIVGPLASSATLAVAESVTGPSGVPHISPSATSPALTALDDDGYLFRTTISDAAQGVVLAQLATDEGYDNVGVIYRDDAYGQGLAEAFAAAFGGTSTLVSYAADGQLSYLAELQQAAAGGADVLLAIGFQETEVFLREAIENDIFAQFLFCDGNKSIDLIVAIGADVLDGFKGTAPGSNPESASTVTWNAAYAAEFGAEPTLPFARETYDAVIALALAVEAAGSTDGMAIRDQLTLIGGPDGEIFIAGADGVAAALEAVRAGTEINYEGAATSVDWDANGDVPSGFIEIWQFSGDGIETVDSVPFGLAD